MCLSEPNSDHAPGSSVLPGYSLASEWPQRGCCLQEALPLLGTVAGSKYIESNRSESDTAAPLGPRPLPKVYDLCHIFRTLRESKNPLICENST